MYKVRTLDRRLLTIPAGVADVELSVGNWFVDALGVARGIGAPLSAERSTVSYGPTSRLLPFAQEFGEQVADAKIGSDGRLVAFEVNPTFLRNANLPVGTIVAGLVLGRYAAHGFFYPPLNDLKVARRHFKRLQLSATANGLVASGLTFYSQRLTVDSAHLGNVTISTPAGVPRRSRTAVGRGQAWIDDRAANPSARVFFYEDDVARVKIRPKASSTPSGRSAFTPAYVDQAMALAGTTLQEISWE